MKIITSAIFVLLIVGCASPYQANGFRGGFSETALAPNVYQVRFRGNGYTSMERASDFALLRSADLTIENGYQYFLITDSQSWQDSMTWVQPGSSTTYTTGSVSAYGNTAYGSATSTTRTTPAMAYNIYKPSTGLVVVFSKEQVEDTFDAQFIRKSIMDKYGMKELEHNEEDK